MQNEDTEIILEKVNKLVIKLTKFERKNRPEKSAFVATPNKSALTFRWSAKHFCYNFSDILESFSDSPNKAKTKDLLLSAKANKGTYSNTTLKYQKKV